jgi:hypothetical protein
VPERKRFKLMVGSIRLSAFADGGQQNGIIDPLHWRSKKVCCVRAAATKRRGIRADCRTQPHPSPMAIHYLARLRSVDQAPIVHGEPRDCRRGRLIRVARWALARSLAPKAKNSQPRRGVRA